MAGVVLRLVLRGRFGEEKWAPVGDTADHATRREDLLASCAGDSEIECQWVVAEGFGGEMWEATILFDLGQVARTDLR
jgi:hypothetical protein